MNGSWNSVCVSGLQERPSPSGPPLPERRRRKPVADAMVLLRSGIATAAGECRSPSALPAGSEQERAHHALGICTLGQGRIADSGRDAQQITQPRV
jgi:hypothetical protein